MGNIFATTMTAIALTAGVPSDIFSPEKSDIIITKFEIDTNRKIIDFSDPYAKSYWDGVKSNGDVDLTKAKFIPVKYNTYNMIFPAYIPDFLLVKAVPQDGVKLATIKIEIGNEYVLYLTCSNYKDGILNSME